MDKISTPSSHTSKPVAANRKPQRGAGPSQQALSFLRQFARVYRVEAGFGMILN